jgi:TM2 domain-containing membrane protein YozV
MDVSGWRLPTTEPTMSPEARAIAISQRLSDGQRAIFLVDWAGKRKEKNTAMLLSLLWLFGVCGVGRAYIGQFGFGAGLFFGGPLTCLIWPLVDTFLIGDAVDAVNHETLNALELIHRG